MRAILIEGHKLDLHEILIDGEKAKHLIKVVRIKLQEKVLVLDGCGNKFLTIVVQISKKNLVLQVQAREKVSPQASQNIHLGICPPKKDAFLDMVRQSSELGLGSITPICSQFSQLSLCENEKLLEKAHKTIKSALVQSNNPYLLKIKKDLLFSDLCNTLNSYDEVFYLCSHSKLSDEINREPVMSPSTNIFIILGPEGGLSEEEERYLFSSKNVTSIHFPTPILRAPTALGTSVGYVLAKLDSMKTIS